jgi:hypothetical protein
MRTANRNTRTLWRAKRTRIALLSFAAINRMSSWSETSLAGECWADTARGMA